jgi:hypothetical protein
VVGYTVVFGLIYPSTWTPLGVVPVHLLSTLFPDSWTADRIKVEVDGAFQNKTVVGNKWTGTTPSGVQVEGYMSPKTTVYPKL